MADRTVLPTDELAAWLRLLETPGIGRQRARRLLRAFGGPREIFEASPAAWREVLDGHKVCEALAQAPEGHDALVERTVQWLQQPDCHLLVLGDPAYPQPWMELADPRWCCMHGAGWRCWASMRWPSSAAATRRRKGRTTPSSSRPHSARPGWSSSPGWRKGSTAPRTKAR